MNDWTPPIRVSCPVTALGAPASTLGALNLLAGSIDPLPGGFDTFNGDTDDAGDYWCTCQFRPSALALMVSKDPAVWYAAHVAGCACKGVPPLSAETVATLCAAMRIGA